MDLLVMVSIGFVLIFLAKHTNAVLKPTITVHRDTEDYPCNRNGATCPVGYYCFEECRPCNPCPDVNTYRVPNNQLTVMEQCVKQGQCPNLCSYMYLKPHQQANQSFCIGALLVTQEPVCELQSCDNGGTLDTQACQCSCSANWNGPTCSDCGLSCVNGGTLDEATCECRCDKDWTGSNCTDCGLTFCENGGTIDPASCQCLCNGDSCSECGLKSCQNGGTLNPTSCQCLCSEDWTGHNCSESRIKGKIPPTQTDVNETSVLVIVLICLAVVLAGGCSIKMLLPRLTCNPKSRSISDVEGALLDYVGDMEAECPTPQSIKVRAMNPNQKLKGKKMKFFCQNADDSQDPVQKWSDAMIWDSALQHLFEGLCPGVKYTILLHQAQDSLKEVNKVEATTPYYPLSVEVSGTAATIRGLKELDINAVQSCACMMLPSCKKWIIVSPEQDELVISDVPPGFDYCVKAGIVDSKQLPSRQKFRCKAEGKLRVDVQEITQDQTHQRTSNCTTFGKVLKSIDLKRSLQVELESKKNFYLAEMVAGALGLVGDDNMRIKDAKTDHVEKLDQILNRRENDTQVHDLIVSLLAPSELKERNETETTQWKEAEDFLIKLVGHTWTNFHCLECIHLLHQAHSV
ncbi:tenascin-like isoform X2 [Patiria miniata]|uniref:EGF-like domain-containing protein n=1 Tax=Patiria miniata TaxID=46514 RepID=A0A913ZY52_PATMI|nr:tenascin-like isoform X2 [Patiria miniata]